MPPIRSQRPPPRGPRRPASRPVPSARAARPGGRAASAGVAAARASRRKALAFGLTGLLFVSLSAILFVLYSIIAGDAEPAETRRAHPFAIPPGAVQFRSLADFEKAPLRPGVPFALTIAEAELNQRIAARVAKQPDLPFHDVTARLLDEEAEFSGGVRAAGLELTPTVTMTFLAENGALRYEISAISFGPVPVPGVARQAISDTVARQLDQQKLTDKYIIDDLQIRPGFVTIVGRLK
ncbi:MAG TPA: hypothetical protein VGL23_16170 [Chloroflexota bacterium]|jgi:hypothetical protein